MKIRIVCKDIPVYAKPGDVGVDLKADIAEPVIIKPGGRALIPTGLKIELPPAVMAVVHPRSGLASKQGLICSTGIIDTGYRGEIKVNLLYHGRDFIVVQPGTRIAQLVFQPVIFAEFEQVDKLTETQRGEGGFGSTGV